MRPRRRLLTPAPAPVASELVDPGRRDALVVFDTRPYAVGQRAAFAPLFALTEAVVAARLGDDARKRLSRAENLLNAWEWRPSEPVS